MVFDIRKLQAKVATTPAPAAPPPVELETQLAASVAAVAINRPASDRPAPPLTVTSIQGSAQAHAMLEFVKDEPSELEALEERFARPEPVATVEDGIDAVEDRAHAAALATPPKARRGRPRKTIPSTSAQSSTTEASGSASAGAATAAVLPTPIVAALDPVAAHEAAHEATLPDVYLAVLALIRAVNTLECSGKTDGHLHYARAVLGLEVPK